MAETCHRVLLGLGVSIVGEAMCSVCPVAPPNWVIEPPSRGLNTYSGKCSREREREGTTFCSGVSYCLRWWGGWGDASTLREEPGVKSAVLLSSP